NAADAVRALVGQVRDASWPRQAEGHPRWPVGQVRRPIRTCRGRRRPPPARRISRALGGRAMIRDLLSRTADLAVLVFAVTSMLSVGLTHSAKQILGPLRDLRALAPALLANFVLVPLLP